MSESFDQLLKLGMCDLPIPEAPLSVYPVPQKLSNTRQSESCQEEKAPRLSTPDTALGVQRGRQALLRAAWNDAKNTGSGQTRHMEIAEVLLAYMVARHFLCSLQRLCCINRTSKLVRPKSPPKEPKRANLIPLKEPSPAYALALQPLPKEESTDSQKCAFNETRLFKPSREAQAIPTKALAIPCMSPYPDAPKPQNFIHQKSIVELPSSSSSRRSCFPLPPTTRIEKEECVGEDSVMSRTMLAEVLRETLSAVRRLAQEHSVVFEGEHVVEEIKKEEDNASTRILSRFFRAWHMAFLRRQEAAALSVRARALGIALRTAKLAALYFHWRRRWQQRTAFKTVWKRCARVMARQYLHRWMVSLVQHRIVERGRLRVALRLWIFATNFQVAVKRKQEVLKTTALRRWKYMYSRRRVRQRMTLLGFFHIWRRRYQICQVLAMVCRVHRAKSLGKVWQCWRDYVRARHKHRRDLEAARLFYQMVCLRRREKYVYLLARVMRLWRAKVFLRLAKK